MERLADDPELVRRLGSAARPRAELFDWSRFTEKMDRQVDQLVSAHALSEARALSDAYAPSEKRAWGFAGQYAECGGES
jgi:hypothetical protein